MRMTIYIMIFLSLINCGSPKIDNKDILGVWNSKDGSSITFLNNNNCIFKNVNFYIFSPFKCNENIKINTKKASWYLDKENEKIHLSYKLPNSNGNGGIDFNFEKSKINKSIYIWIGDPDDGIKYEYIKE